MNHRLPDMFAGLTLATAVALAPVVFADTSEPPPVVAPATTTVAPATTTTVAPTTTLPPPSTTTSTTIPAGDWQCPEWIGLAIDVGWPTEQLPTLDRVLFRESTCRPDAFNDDDPNGGSRGLAQVNGVWLDWFLPSLGIAHTMNDLFDPATNLRAALAIWQRSGWRPWGLK
jgi:hypothetical protein